MIRVFIGYDPREAVAFKVLAHSILERASQPVAISPVRLGHLAPHFTRARDPLASTDFSISRFMVPSLCDFDGWAIFMDCDMLCRDDIAHLWDLRDSRYALQVVQHDHRPSELSKFLGHQQTTYRRKNWSSVMLMNCGKCWPQFSPATVNVAPGLQLHQFTQFEDAHIGALPARWNYLVGHSTGEASLVHFTTGGPWFAEYSQCEYAAEWFAERDRALAVSP